MTVRLPVGPSVITTHQSESVGLGVLPRIIENVAIFHPWRHHTELVLVRRSSVECKNVRMVHMFPQQYFFAKPLQVKVSSPWNPGGRPTEKAITLVVLFLSSSGANLNALTATFLPFQSRFHRSVYPRVANGISSRVLKSSSIRQDLGSLPNVPHSFRSMVSAVPLRSPGIFAC
jgi:hypothetical protein